MAYLELVKQIVNRDGIIPSSIATHKKCLETCLISKHTFYSVYLFTNISGPFTSELRFTSTPSQVEITWTSAECMSSSFLVEYALTLRGQCEAVSSPIFTNLGSVSGSPVNLDNLLPYSTYTVNITGVGSSGVNVWKLAEVTTQESGMLFVISNITLIFHISFKRHGTWNKCIVRSVSDCFCDFFFLRGVNWRARF